MYIYYNHKLLKEAFLQPACQGFQFGYGLFETILISNGVPCFMEMHYQRIMKGCSKLGLELKLSLEELYAQAARLSELMEIPEGRLKLICFRDVDGDSTIMTLAAYRVEESHIRNGLSLSTSNIKRNPYSPLCYIKSLNYTENIIAKENAKACGFDEALFLNINNKLCEGAVSNIFWSKENVIYTPELACGILEGITRSQVISICSKLGIKLKEGSYDLTELLDADEAFATNSLMGIMPVCRVDNTIYDVTGYKMINDINNEYRKLVGAAAHSCPGIL